MPNIVVSRQDEFLEGSPKLVTFWEKLRLEPYSARKNIRYFAVYPSNEQLEPICTQFFKGLSTLYETCHLGVHQPGSIGSYRRGLVPVPLLRKYSNNQVEMMEEKKDDSKRKIDFMFSNNLD